MTISSSPQSGTTEKLDDVTEQAIAGVLIAQNSVSSATRLADDWRQKKMARDIRVSALRQRIRELVEEARDKGYLEGQHNLAEIMRPSR